MNVTPSRITIVLFAAALSGCPRPPPPVVPAAGCGGTRGCLQIGEKGTVIVGAHAGFRRGTYFYVLSERPIAEGTSSRDRIGLVEAIRNSVAQDADSRDRFDLVVHWVCPPPGQPRPAIPRAGLPVEELREDTLMNRGACWTRHTWADRTRTIPAGLVDLELSAGEGDGVHSGDRYDVLEAVPDKINQTVSFEKAAACVIQDVRSTTSFCRLDRTEWKEMGELQLKQDGYVRRAECPHAGPAAVP